MMFLLQHARSEEIGQDEARADAELERIFDKASFRKLSIVGQFNLGFIVARLGADLFIIDQHASDEKFNFERLTRETQLNRQPLLVPQQLDLTPSELITVRCCLMNPGGMTGWLHCAVRVLERSLDCRGNGVF